jgi:hypothetical protein
MDNAMDIDPRPVCTLDSCPAEIVHDIAMHLAFPSRQAWESQEPYGVGYESLRATCKSLEMKTHHAFVRLFFKSRTVDFSEEGIGRLMDIAAVQEYADAVVMVRFMRKGYSLFDWLLPNRDQVEADTEEEREAARLPLRFISADWRRRSVSSIIACARNVSLTHYSTLKGVASAQSCCPTP